MKAGTKGQVSVHIDAPPDVVYGLVSDVTRMGEWSPETRSVEWLDGATGPTKGAKFKGRNKAERGPSWSGTCEVLVADPGREFTFTRGGPGETRWSYRMEPSPTGRGTELIESFELVKKTPAVLDLLTRLLAGIDDREADMKRKMQVTVDRIKDAAERASAST